MGSIKKLAGQTLIYGLSSIIGRLAVWALTPVYTAYMDQSEYGIFSDLYSFVTYFLVLLTFGLETSYFRFSMDNRLDPRPYNHAFIFVTALAALFLAIFGLGHEQVAAVLDYSGRERLILMVVAIIFLDTLTAMPMARLRFDERPMVFAFVSLANIATLLILNVFFIVILGYREAEWIFLANLIASLLKFGLLVMLSSDLTAQVTSKMGKWGKKLGKITVLPSSFKLDPLLMRAMVGFGFFIMLAGLFGMINQNSDVNFIRRLWGDEPAMYQGAMLKGSQMAGIYSANKKLAVFILLVTQAFRYAAEPFFFRHAGQSDSRVTFARVLHYFMLAALGVFLLISSFRYEMVSFRFFGFTLIDQSYWGGLSAVPLLLLSFVLLGAYINLSIWFKLTKQVRFGILFSGAGVLVLVLLNLILVPTMGFIGSAIGMFASFAVACVLAYIVGQRYYPIPYHLPRMALNSAIILGAFFLNMSLGSGSAFTSAVFYEKLTVVALTFGLIYYLERKFPVMWKAWSARCEAEWKRKGIRIPKAPSSAENASKTENPGD